MSELNPHSTVDTFHLKSKKVKFMSPLEENSIIWSHLDSSSGDHECLYKISWCYNIIDQQAANVAKNVTCYLFSTSTNQSSQQINNKSTFFKKHLRVGLCIIIMY